MVRILAKFLGLEFQRIQFTNDLLPSDILGSMVFDLVHDSLQETSEIAFMVKFENVKNKKDYW